MSNLTNKVLQEISDLAKNMDVLVKELRSAREEQSKSVDKLTENLSKFEEQKIKRDEESLSSQEVLFKNLTESIQKSLEDRDDKILNDLNKSLSSDIEKAFSDFPSKVAQVKSKDSTSTSDIIDQIAAKTAEKTPGLKTGGEVTKKGVAVVGEDGPELVELSKGDKVKTKEQQLLEMELEDIRRSAIKKEKLSEEESIVNSFGVKVPQKEIEKERESLEKEFPEFTTSEIEEEIQSFIEGYRETMTLADIQKLNSKENLNPQEKGDPKDSQKKIINPGDSPKKIREPENLETAKDVKKDGLFSKLKEGGKSIVTDAKKSFEIERKNLSDSLKSVKKEKIKTPETVAETTQSPKEQIKVESVRGDLDKLAESKFKNEDTQKKETTVSPAMEVPQKKEVSNLQNTNTGVEAGKAGKENTKTKKMSTANDPSPTDLNTDMKEIKGLLTAIYKTLSGPLSISSDTPFRPNSNHL